MCVRLAVGPVDKRLRVVGERGWRYAWPGLHHVSEPVPFSTMPIDWQRAYGGPDHPANPAGCGYTGVFGAARTGCMPNIEFAAAPVTGHTTRLAPAGFGPIGQEWAPRKGKLGTYDARWLAAEAPGFARDINWTAFNLAPEDQWLPGHFEGGEAYRLEGMHPAQDVIEGRLPQFKARAFLLESGAPAEAAREVPLALDTVWFIPALELGVMAFHGQIEIADSDGLGIEAVMGGYERIGEPRPDAHYHEVLRLRADARQAAQHVFNEAQLAPGLSAATRERNDAFDRAAHEGALAASQQRLAELEREHWQAQGCPPPPGHQPLAPAPAPFTAPSARALAACDFDLTGMLREATAAAEKARADGESMLAALPPAPRRPAGQAAELAAALERASVPAYDLLPASETGRDPAAAEQLARLDELRARGLVSDADDAHARKAIADAPAQRRAARRAAPSSMASARIGADAAAGLGQQVRRWHASGISLAGRDLAGADLRGVMLAGADLREAMLEGADLSGARLAGANLAGAALTGALLRLADLTGSNLDGANLSATDAEGASLRRASLRKAQASDARWHGADLSGAVLEKLLAPRIDLTKAVLDGVTAQGATLLQACAQGSRWHGAQLDKLVALRADFRRADLGGARLAGCAVNQADFAGSRWDGAVLEGLQAAGGTDWSGASLRAVRATSCGLHGAVLDGADLGASHWLRCDFSAARLDAARLDGAHFPHSVFMGASLAGASAVGADFYQALCRKTDLRGATLAGTRFVQAEMTGALTGAPADKEPA
jgi:uncharacterized protein YjbI with pentapeptide repeats